MLSFAATGRQVVRSIEDASAAFGMERPGAGRNCGDDGCLY